MSCFTASKSSLVPDFSRPMFITMSRSCAPSFSTRLASSHLAAENVAPSGKPITTPTGTPVPASVSAAVPTHVGFTMAHAKRCSAASWHRRITCARVASGFQSVWSRTAASVGGRRECVGGKRRGVKMRWFCDRKGLRGNHLRLWCSWPAGAALPLSIIGALRRLSAITSGGASSECGVV